MLNGHLDTVALGERSKWRVDPLSGEVKGARLYGRGSFDMKASVAAATFAAIALKQTKHQLSGKLRLVFCVDEESAECTGIKEIIAKGLLADACIVGEPSAAQTINIGARGCYRFELIVRGKSGHTSNPDGGVNAVTKMAKALLALDKLRFRHMKHPLFSPPSITPGTIISGGTGINIYPDECLAKVDCRLGFGMTKTSAKKQIIACLNSIKRFDPDFKYQIEDLCIMPLALTPDQDRIVKATSDAVTKIRRRKPKLCTMNGGSDANFLIQAGVPCAITGTQGANLHAENEYVSVRSILEAAKIYALAVDSYLNQ